MRTGGRLRSGSEQKQGDQSSVLFSGRAPRRSWVVGGLLEHDGAVAIAQTVQSVQGVAGWRVSGAGGPLRQSVLQLPDYPLLPQDNGFSLTQTGLDLLLLPAQPRFEQQELRRQRPQLLSLFARQSCHQVLL